jgi:hypothetical protein
LETKKGKAEKNYQYSVIRFLIRTGLFNITQASYRKQDNVPGFQNLLDTNNSLTSNRKKELLDIHEEQYDTSSKKDGFLFDKASADKEKNDNVKKFGIKYSEKDDEKLNELVEYIDKYFPSYINNRIVTFELGFFKLTQDDNTISHIYWLPVITNWKDRIIGGANFLNCDMRIGMADDIEIMPSTSVPQVLITAMLYFTGLVDDKQIEEIQDETRIHTETAAAVSIMSRNISHNIASHVLSYIKNILGDEASMLRNNVFENLLTSEFILNEKYINRTSNDDIYDELENLEHTIGKYSRENAKREYQERLVDVLKLLNTKEIELSEILDYQNFFIRKYQFNSKLIADDNYLNTPELVAPYMHAISDLLNYFQERQDYIGSIASNWQLYFGFVPFRDAVSDYFVSTKTDKSASGNHESEHFNLILDFIAFSEGYKREDIEINFEVQANNKNTKLSLDNLEVALPSGITGRQGIYTILENLIRNTAKHGTPREDRPEQKLKFDVIISEDDNNKDYYRMQIIDHSGNATKKTTRRINNVLRNDLTKADGSIDEHNKGVKEMQIAAAWLRDIKPYELREHFELPILKVEVFQEKHLKYDLYLKKPKLAVLLVKNKTAKTKIKKALSKQVNEDYFTIEAITEVKDWKSMTYRFVMVHEGANIEKYRELIPIRIIENITVELLQNVLTKEKLKVLLYQKWLDKQEKNEYQFNLHHLNEEEKPSTLPIGINDRNEKREDCEKELANIGTDVGEIYRKSKILFRKHNDTQTEFERFQKNKHYDNIIFAEGISGNNSTNRLVREEPITEYWCMKMRESALTKVAIIDERMWKSIKERCNNNKQLLAFEQEKYEKKHIYIYSAEIRNKEFAFFDLKDNKIAYIDEKLKFHWNDGAREPFHFIAIHQGLIDKMLNYGNESQLLKDKTDNNQKNNILFDEFKKVFDAKFRYLVHSGRSKTPIIPKNSAFVQLSSLDSALADCKFTLTELLYSAINEQEQ